MTVHLPDPAAATVIGIESDAGTIRVAFPIRNAAQHNCLVELLEYARDGGFAVELKLLHYKGRPVREKP